MPEDSVAYNTSTPTIVLDTAPDYTAVAEQLEALGDAMSVLSTRLIGVAGKLRQPYALNYLDNAPQP